MSTVKLNDSVGNANGTTVEILPDGLARRFAHITLGVALMATLVAGIGVQAEAQASSLTKVALDASGNPITGPIKAGDTINYVLSYKGAGPISITDTPAPQLGYVGSSLKMPPGWTKNPSVEFGGPGGNTPTTFTGNFANLSSVSAVLALSATGSPSSGGDGWLPVIVGSKVYGFNHGVPNVNIAGAKVDCWDKATLNSCSPFSSPALKDGSGNLLHTGGFVDAAIRSTKVYYSAARRNGANSEIGVACFDTANFVNGSTNFCGFTVWQSSTVASASGFPAIAPGSALRSFVYHSGLVEQPASDNLWAVVANASPIGAGTAWQNLSLMCRTIAGAPCVGVTDQDLGKFNVAVATSYDQVLSFDPQANRLWAMVDRTTMTCRQLSNPSLVCAGFNNSANKTMTVTTGSGAFATPTGACSSWANVAFNCYKVDGSLDPAMTTLLTGGIFGNILGTPLVLGTKWYFPMGKYNGSSWTTDGAVCLDATTVTHCSGFGTAGKMQNPSSMINYGYMADPADPACLVGLGDKGIPFKFNAATGGSGCGAGSSVTVEPGLNFCDNKPHTVTWDKATFSPASTGFSQIKVKNSATNVVVATIPVTAALSYDFSSIGYGANPKLTLEFVSSGSGSNAPTVNVSWKADVDAQVCMAFTVASCPAGGGAVSNKAATQGNQSAAASAMSADVSCGVTTTTATSTTTTTRTTATTTTTPTVSTTIPTSTTIKGGGTTTTIKSEGTTTTAAVTIAPTLPPPPVSITVAPTLAPPPPTSPVQVESNPDLPFVVLSGNQLPFTG
jgi:hypothetical protein